MGYINTLFTGQSEASGDAVSESSRFLSIDSISGHPAVYRYLKTYGKVENEKLQKQNY
ncbi:hypothetical protein [Fibrobacter sp.]|jgi:hypothetical protein|uniref:hypothetical protein n=1 Tax=Fibrobacter sp. TaxID=35828 RepID=UPI0025C5CEAE|nr:hypothetical protein [Fibrobacter sp.]MBR3072716.1 hypothetical protein [Fibrobacter sp.]